jgi:glycosyltransferase involved in cell wall biosynthesis
MVYWQQCLQQMKELPVNISVIYHGEILPTNVESMLHKGQVFILPSKSENFGHAIYEALSAGKPVITSHFTPWNDLEKNKAGLNIELTEDAVAKAILFFATMDNEEYSLWSIRAKEYAENILDINSIKAQYQALFAADEPCLRSE